MERLLIKQQSKNKIMEDKREQGAVTISVENKIATIEFYHPSHNSLPGQLLAKLAATITKAKKYNSATFQRVIKVAFLLTSTVRNFRSF